jgi:hypothetical protein
MTRKVNETTKGVRGRLVDPACTYPRTILLLGTSLRQGRTCSGIRLGRAGLRLSARLPDGKSIACAREGFWRVLVPLCRRGLQRRRYRDRDRLFRRVSLRFSAATVRRRRRRRRRRVAPVGTANRPAAVLTALSTIRSTKSAKALCVSLIATFYIRRTFSRNLRIPHPAQVLGTRLS